MLFPADVQQQIAEAIKKKETTVTFLDERGTERIINLLEKTVAAKATPHRKRKVQDAEVNRCWSWQDSQQVSL